MHTARDPHVNRPIWSALARWRNVLPQTHPCALRYRLALLALVLWLPTRLTQAQPDPLNEAWRWARFGTESGLPSDRVLDVVETSTGVAWARTEARLAWYDDHRWHPVTVVKGATPQLPSRLVPDRQGGILAVASRRLYRVDQQGISSIPIEEEVGPLVVRDVVPLDDTDLLVLTSGGLYRHHAGGLDPFPGPEEIPPEKIADTIFITAVEGVWLSGAHGLFQWTGAAWVKRFHLPTRLLQVGRWGGMAAVTDGSPTEYGLWTWAPGSPPRHRVGDDIGLITSVYADAAGDAIVTSASGSVRVRRAGRWARLRPTPAPLINPRFIRARSNGDLWLGTEEGLFLFRASSTRWTRWRASDITESNNVNAILQTRNGDVWMATGAGIVIRRTDGTFDHVRTIQGTTLRVVTGLAEDRNGNIWVASGSSFAGAFRWDGTAWARVGTEAGLDAPRIHKIVKDRSGRLWFLGLGLHFAGAKNGPGAFVYDGVRFTPWGPAEGLPSGRVYDFDEGPDGARYFATLEGLSRYHDGRWTHWTTEEGLLDNRVFTVAIGDDGRVWFGHQNAGHGLGVLDDQDRPRYLTVADGLIDDEVWSVHPGPDTTLWIGTRGGLARYRNGIFASFNPSTGLEHRHVWPVLPLAAQVYVGTIGGGVYVLNFAELSTPPPAVTVASPMVASGHVSFQWQTLAFSGQQPTEAIETRYRLDDQPWSAWSAAREASVLNVSPGKHTFTVQAKSLFGVVASEGTTASFRIAPPFYLHPLFLAAVSLWILSMSALGVSYWRRQRRSEEHFSKVFYASPMAIAIASLGEGRLIEVNERFEQLVGYSRDEVIGKTTRALNLWPDPTMRLLMIDRIRRGAVLHDLDVQFTTKSGDARAIQGSVEVVELGGRRRLLWMGIDVTERKKAEEALRLSQARLEAAQARAKMGSWEYYPDTQAGYWSKEMFLLYGLDPAQDAPSMGELLELIHPEDRQQLQASQMQSLYTLEPISIDYRTNPARGPERHLNATVHTVRDQDGQPIYLAGTVMDFTERKQAEADRERLIAELEAKNAELERFTYTVSHDLKSPLVTIKGFVGLLEQDALAGDAQQMKRDIEHINHATDKMHRLLDELLELSRIGRLMNPPQTVSLSDLAHEATRLVAGRLAARGVEVEIAEAMPVVFGDRLRLLEVYQNLIDNAVKFMGEQRAPKLEIGARWEGNEGKQVLCWVRDNGMGIASKYHEKVFGLFERLEVDREGTGIGLALVRRIVEVHGGRIWVESEGPGHGSTFYFTLPAAEAS